MNNVPVKEANIVSNTLSADNVARIHTFRPIALTLSLEPFSKVESLFLNGEPLILVLNIIKFSVMRNYTKSYTMSIVFAGYVYIPENSLVPSCMLFCNSPYPHSLCKSLIEEDPSAGM